MAFALVLDEVSQLVRAADKVGFVENARSQAAEKAELSVLVDLAARAEQRRTRSNQLSERDEVILIPTSSVQQEQRG
jgi:hypothetical protein